MLRVHLCVCDSLLKHCLSLDPVVEREGARCEYVYMCVCVCELSVTFCVYEERRVCVCGIVVYKLVTFPTHYFSR